MCHIFFLFYNATAIANAKPADAAPTGTGGVDASRYTALSAGKVQNTSSVPAKLILDVLPKELLITVSLDKVSVAASVTVP